MHIVVVGYLFVIALMALVVLASGGWLKGMAIALFLGALPVWIFNKVFPNRRRAHRRE